MSHLVSIMIPTRLRTKRLVNTISTLRDTATGKDFEILFRIDEDDKESRPAIDDVCRGLNHRVFVGQRLAGYGSLDKDFYSQLEDAADSSLVWIAGDDMIVSGDWYGELQKAPSWGAIIQPEISKLGGSTYPNADAQAFPIFPKHCWRILNYPTGKFPVPFDSEGDRFLRKERGWHTHFLAGVTFWHDRPPEPELMEHRKL